MKLIGSTTSPYVRKIRVLLEELGLEYEFVNDPPWAPGSRVSQFNPLGKVPTWIDSRGEVWFESALIVEAIEAEVPSFPFLPEERRARLAVRRTAALIDGVTDAAVSWLLETRRKPEKQDPNWISRQKLKVDRGLDALEEKWASREPGAPLDVADLGLGAGLGWMDFRHAEFDWRATRPHLAQAVQELLARPSFVKTVPTE